MWWLLKKPIENQSILWRTGHGRKSEWKVERNYCLLFLGPGASSSRSGSSVESVGGQN